MVLLITVGEKISTDEALFNIAHQCGDALHVFSIFEAKVEIKESRGSETARPVPRSHSYMKVTKLSELLDFITGYAYVKMFALYDRHQRFTNGDLTTLSSA